MGVYGWDMQLYIYTAYSCINRGFMFETYKIFMTYALNVIQKHYLNIAQLVIVQLTDTIHSKNGIP